jgi:hypothetical protein
VFFLSFPDSLRLLVESVGILESLAFSVFPISDKDKASNEAPSVSLLAAAPTPELPLDLAPHWQRPAQGACAPVNWFAAPRPSEAMELPLQRGAVAPKRSAT